MTFNKKFRLEPALCASIEFAGDFRAIFDKLFDKFKAAINFSVNAVKYISVEDLSARFTDEMSKYRARNICEILIASILSYRKNFSRSTKALFAEKIFPNGQTRYRFNTAIRFYFAWVEKIFVEIVDETHDGQLYITNTTGNAAKEISIVLGILEALGVLNFKMTGGANSQLYIHINQIKNLKNILDDGGRYSNRILNSVALRHKISVAMLTYIYEGEFDSAAIWDLPEDYFLGKIPAEVTANVDNSR